MDLRFIRCLTLLRRHGPFDARVRNEPHDGGRGIQCARDCRVKEGERDRDGVNHQRDLPFDVPSDGRRQGRIPRLPGEDQALKGTALEYLDNVLPGDVGGLVLARVGAARSRNRARPPREVLEDLLRASDGATRARAGVRRGWLRPRG